MQYDLRINVFDSLRTVREMPETQDVATISGRGIHESCFRSRHVLAVVKDLLQQDFKPWFVLEFIDEAYREPDESIMKAQVHKAADTIEELRGSLSKAFAELAARNKSIDQLQARVKNYQALEHERQAALTRAKQRVKSCQCTKSKKPLIVPNFGGRKPLGPR